MRNYIHFIFDEQSNRKYLLAAIILSVALMCIFKLLYPYPNMSLDSYFYVKAAAVNANVAIWPIGYSKFLRAVMAVFHSAVALVWIQYILLEFACVLFFFTIIYFWELKGWLKDILFLFLFVNPLFLYVCNFILSDALFLTLSLFWITLLLWLIKQPRAYMIWVHAVLLMATFATRYNALFYPLIGAIAFLISPQHLWKKFAGIALEIVLIAGFIIYTSDRMMVETDARLFTPFSGWRMANNALYMYGHQYQSSIGHVPGRFAQLDKVVRYYFSNIQSVDNLLDYRAFAGGGYYIFKANSPLVVYMQFQSRMQGRVMDLKCSAPIASLYSEYGQYLIRKDPLHFIKYFILPNAIRYAYPPMEVFSSSSAFALGNEDHELLDFDKNWLGVNTLIASPYLRNLRTVVLSPFPLLVCLTHVLFLIGLVGFLCLGGIRRCPQVLNKCLLLIGTYCVFECVFSVTAAAMVLRYLLFILVIKFTFSVVFIDYIYKLKLDKN